MPVLFPQFADRGCLPKHGFARSVEWICVEEHRSSDFEAIIFELDTRQVAVPDWPFEARLRLKLAAGPSSCVLTFSIENGGTSPFAWTGGLHPYFQVADVRSIRVDGLGGLPIEDRYDRARIAEAATGPSFDDRPFERLYGTAPTLSLVDGVRRLTLRSAGFTEWMVWNPGRDGARALADLPDGDWYKFICVEPVIARVPAVLEPGSIFTGVLSVTCAP